MYASPVPGLGVRRAVHRDLVLTDAASADPIVGGRVLEMGGLFEINGLAIPSDVFFSWTADGLSNGGSFYQYSVT